MKKLTRSSIISFFLALLLPSFLLGATGVVRAKSISHITTTALHQRSSSSVDDFYLLSPSMVAQNDEHTFVYDSETQKIKVIEDGQIVISKEYQTPLSLIASGEHLFVCNKHSISAFRVTNEEVASGVGLEQTDSRNLVKTAILKLDGGVLSDQDFNFESVFEEAIGFALVPEAENEFSLFVCAESPNMLDVHQIKLTYHPDEKVFDAQYNDIVYNSNNASFGIVESKLTQISVAKDSDGYVFLCSNQEGLFLVRTRPTLTCEKLMQQGSSEVQAKSFVHVATSDGFAFAEGQKTFLIDLSGDVIAEADISPTCLAAFQNKVFGLLSAEAQVVQIFPENQDEPVYKNNFSLPQESTLNTLETLEYLRTNQEVVLKEFPYSVNGIKLAQNTDLVVLASEQEGFPQMAYVTCVQGGVNVRGFVETQSCTSLQTTPISRTGRAIKEFALTTIPSSVHDQNNPVLESITVDSEFEILQDTAQIKNTTYFLMIKTKDGVVGFAPRSAVAMPLQSKSQKQNTNATVVRDSFLFENADGTNEIIPLPKNTRVKLFHKLNPKSTYTKVSVQMDDGIYVGYVKTADLQSDALTTFQIVGIVLLAASVVILLLITAFWSKNRKRRS